MKRYLSTEQFERVTKDFGFLIDSIKNSHGELDLRLRSGYFNLYYKGNSLVKMEIKRGGYIASIHEKFATADVFQGDRRFDEKSIKRGNYLEFRLQPELLHPFLQKKYLDALGKNIARVGYSEEITFEQMLITDNQNRDDFLIIDRQVTDSVLRGKRIDLLALRLINDNRFYFQVIEVKLGNNPELRSDVANQISGYIKHLKRNFANWKHAYEQTYRQMKQLDLFNHPKFESVEIVDGVEGLIVVGGYSGIGKANIAELKNYYADVKIKQFVQRI